MEAGSARPPATDGPRPRNPPSPCPRALPEPPATGRTSSFSIKGNQSTIVQHDAGTQYLQHDPALRDDAGYRALLQQVVLLRA